MVELLIMSAVLVGGPTADVAPEQDLERRSGTLRRVEPVLPRRTSEPRPERLEEPPSDAGAEPDVGSAWRSPVVIGAAITAGGAFLAALLKAIFRRRR